MGSAGSVRVEGIDEPLVRQKKPALCINSAYVATASRLLTMKTKSSLSGKDRIIINEDTNKEILQVRGKSMRRTPKLNICAANGSVVARLKQTSSKPVEFTINNAVTDRFVAIVRLKSKKVGYRSKVQFEVIGAKKLVLYRVDGTYDNFRFVIRNAVGQIVAKSSREFVGTGGIGLKIGKGNDVIVIAAIISAIETADEYERD